MISGSASKYPVLSLDEIKRLPINLISAPDSVLFLWATTPLLPEAFDVMKSWGFCYKTSLYWEKIAMLGLGFWYRGQVEQLLLGVKGNVRAFRIQKPNLIQSKVRAHSQKPDEMYELIEACGLSPKLELFASTKRGGWDCLGDQIDSQDIRLSLAKLVSEVVECPLFI